MTPFYTTNDFYEVYITYTVCSHIVFSVTPPLKCNKPMTNVNAKMRWPEKNPIQNDKSDNLCELRLYILYKWCVLGYIVHHAIFVVDYTYMDNKMITLCIHIYM